MFVIGGPVRGGVYGEYLGLSDHHLVFEGNLSMMTPDLRSVYATVLGGFFDAEPAEDLGGAFAPLGFR